MLGSHLSAEDFTDDALGRCLDNIYKYGPTKLVTAFTFPVASELDILGKTMHVDTTSLTLYGEYGKPYKQTKKYKYKKQIYQKLKIYL